MSALTRMPPRRDAPEASRADGRDTLPAHVRRLNAGWGGFMLAMAGVNGWFAASGRSDVYVEFADEAYLELYRRAFETLVAPHPLPWVVALTAFEAAVGVATLSRGPARMLGLGAAAAFILLLTPSNPSTLANPVLAAVPVYLLARHARGRLRP